MAYLYEISHCMFITNSQVECEDESCLQFGLPDYLWWKMESCIMGEHSYERYYRWYHGCSPAFWHLALITGVPHIKRTKHIHAQCYILMCLQREAGELLTSTEQGNEQLHAYLSLLSSVWALYGLRM